MQTGAHNHHKTPGRARQPRHVVVGCALLECRLELYFERKEAYINNLATVNTNFLPLYAVV